MVERYDHGNYTSYEDFKANFNVKIPDNFNFAYDIVDEWAERDPSRLALLYTNEEGAERFFSFADIKRMSDKTANYFKSLGIKKGDSVMLILKRHYEFWFAIVALHKIGAVAIPATHLLTKKDIAYRNNAADIKMIVAVGEEELLDSVDEAEKNSPSLKIKVQVGGKPRKDWGSFTGEVEAASDVWHRPTGADATQNADPFLLYFTSGTTGMPKMVLHDFTYPLGHIVTTRYWQNVDPNGIHLTVAETGWAKAAWGKIYGQWICGTAVFVYEFERFIAKDLMAVVAKYGVTTFCAPPTVYRYMIKEDMKKYDFSKLKYAVVAGEPLNPEVYQQFYSQTGLKLMEGYGQTELIVVAATYPWMEPKPGSMGKPSPMYEIDIVDENNESCAIGEEGQIVINISKGRPLGMFNGYYKDPELTRKVMHDGFYYTGDMAWKDEDGYLWFVGRADDVIKSSGYRIGPFEVESALLEHPAVLECAVTGVPDPERGCVVKATVVLVKGYTPSDDLATELKEHVKKVTAPYKYPRIVEFVEELPKTISGKIRRVEIREKSKGENK